MGNLVKTRLSVLSSSWPGMATRRTASPALAYERRSCPGGDAALFAVRRRSGNPSCSVHMEPGSAAQHAARAVLYAASGRTRIVASMQPTELRACRSGWRDRLAESGVRTRNPHAVVSLEWSCCDTLDTAGAKPASRKPGLNAGPALATC